MRSTRTRFPFKIVYDKLRRFSLALQLQNERFSLSLSLFQIVKFRDPIFRRSRSHEMVEKNEFHRNISCTTYRGKNDSSSAFPPRLQYYAYYDITYAASSSLNRMKPQITELGRWLGKGEQLIRRKAIRIVYLLRRVNSYVCARSLSAFISDKFVGPARRRDVRDFFDQLCNRVTLWPQKHYAYTHVLLSTFYTTQ